MINKRLLLASCLISTDMHHLVPRRRDPMLLVVNYHRLRQTAGQPTEFDDGVFGPDEQTFRRQIQWLKSATEVLDEDALLGLDSTRQWPPGTVLSAVTFDDAYVDCYTRARPVLDEMGVRGIFFVPVELIESRQLGWWDLATFMLKMCRLRTVRINGTSYELAQAFRQSLHSILNLFKLQPTEQTTELLQEISSACRVAPPTRDQQSAELMSWDQIRALRAAGHAIGSHTLSHRVLATLTVEDQAREIHESQRVLEALLGAPIRSFAYPVGGPDHINPESVRLVREAGYSQAFTFNTGTARVPPTDRFQIPRESADTLAMLKSKVLLPGLMGLP